MSMSPQFQPAPQGPGLPAALAAAMSGHALIPANLAAPLLAKAIELVSEAHQLVGLYRARIDELERLSTTDPLTGLANRRGFELQLAQSLHSARRFGETGVLALIDLDDFKTINDRNGHLAGDAALVHFSRLLRGKLRETDIIARFGGDEFAALLTKCDVDAASERLRSVAAEIAETELDWQGHHLTVRASIGTAPYGATDAMDDLFRRADLALYADKRFKGFRIRRPKRF